MQATLDFTSFLEEGQFGVEAFDGFRELAFADKDSFDRLQTVIAQLEERIRADAAAAPAHAMKLGICYFHTQNHEKARSWFEKAPANAERSYYLAQVLHDERKFDEALAEIEEAARQGWDKSACESRRIETLLAVGRLDDAEAAINQSNDTSSPHWHCLRGRVAQGRGEFEIAAEAFEKATELDDEHPEPLFHHANLANLLGDDETARQLYQDCAHLPFVHVNALINLALMYEDDGEYDEAAACLRRVLATNPNHERANLFLRDVLSAQDMFYDEHQEKIQEEHDAVLDTPVSDFELSVRARNCLKRMSINTLGDLLRISERELLAYKNFGETSLSEIKAMLTQKGLVLGQCAGTPPPLSSDAAPAEAITGEIDQGNRELLSRSLSSLELSVRSRKCLQRLGLTTIGELMACSELDLMSSKNFGQTSLAEIKQRVNELGLTFRQT